MAFMPAEQIVVPTYQSMQFNGTYEHAAELLGAINAGLAGQLLRRATIEGFQEAGTVGWRINLVRMDDTQMPANPTDWIVVASTGVIRVLDNPTYLAEFQPPAA